MQAVAGQPYCTTCRRSSKRIGARTSLKPCPDCHLAFSCADCVSSHTLVECQHYQLLGQLELSRLQHFEKYSSMSTGARPSRLQECESYQPLSSLNGWSGYHKWAHDTPDSELDIEHERLSPYSRAAVKDNDVRSPPHQLLATDSLTMPLTIVAALEDCSCSLDTADCLTLHIVGAAGKEFRSLHLFEEVLHLLPTLQRLDVVLVGPESPGASAGQTGDLGQEIELDCCNGCTERRRRRTVTSFQGGYDEYAAKPAYTKPDLAVLFHSGRSQANVEEWKPTTRFLVESETRTLCTTYTEREAIEEAAELYEMGTRFLIRPEINQWRGLAPMPELLDGQEHTAYYHNYYRYLFQGRMDVS